MAFDGLRILSLESRRSEEMGILLRKQGGEAFIAPSMREVPIADNPDVFTFYERLRHGDFEMVILLTGVGARAVDTILGPGLFAAELKKVAVVPRGPKPQAVLREWGVPWAVSAPSPNTWRELLAVTADRPERRIAVQEYGRPNEDLLAGLRERGCEVTAVRVYQWALPDAAGRIAYAIFDQGSLTLDLPFTTNFYLIESILRLRLDLTADLLGHMFMPALALAIPLAAIIGQLLKQSLKEVMNLDYVTLARTKGYGETHVILHQALRNAVLPTLTLVGVQFTFLIGGTVIIERLFSYEGLGNMAIEAVINRDLPLIQGIVILFAVIFTAVNLIVDLLYAVLNPRLRHA